MVDELSVHTLRITGICMQHETQSFVTVSDDCQIKATNLGTKEPIYGKQPSQGQLKQLLESKKRNCLIASDSKGGLHMFTRAQEAPGQLESVVSLSVDGNSEVKGMCLNSLENYLAAGCQNGQITVFDLGAVGRERLAKPYLTLQGRANVRCLQWRETPRREIIAGHQDGLVTVWDFKMQAPIFVLTAHTQAITQMQWLEEKQILITCGKDKSIKFWQFPPVWVDEK